MREIIEDIIFLGFLFMIFFSGFYLGKDSFSPEISKDLNEDGKINCKDIQIEVYDCYKGKNYYVQNCRTDNGTEAHAWVKVWINYIPLENGINECKECITDVYGNCYSNTSS